MSAAQESDRLLATFKDRSAADRAAERARQLVGEGAVRVGSTDDILDADSIGQDRQMNEVGSAFSGGVMTGAQARGAYTLGIGCALLGALLLAPLALVIDAGDVPKWALALAFALCGAMGFGAAGFVFGGGRQPEREGELRSTNNDVIIAIEVTDGDNELEKMLVEAGAVDIVHADGSPSRTPTNQIESPPARHAGPNTGRIDPTS